MVVLQIGGDLASAGEDIGREIGWSNGWDACREDARDPI